MIFLSFFFLQEWSFTFKEKVYLPNLFLVNYNNLMEKSHSEDQYLRFKRVLLIPTRGYLLVTIAKKEQKVWKHAGHVKKLDIAVVNVKKMTLRYTKRFAKSCSRKNSLIVSAILAQLVVFLVVDLVILSCIKMLRSSFLSSFIMPEAMAVALLVYYMHNNTISLHIW